MQTGATWFAAVVGAHRGAECRQLWDVLGACAMWLTIRSGLTSMTNQMIAAHEAYVFTFHSMTICSPTNAICIGNTGAAMPWPAELAEVLLAGECAAWHGAP